MSGGYRFGDGTKWLLGKVSTAASGAASVITGKEEYQFGDITRTLFAAISTGLNTAFADWDAEAAFAEGTDGARDAGAALDPAAPAAAAGAAGGAGAGAGAGAGGDATDSSAGAGGASGEEAGATPKAAAARDASTPLTLAFATLGSRGPRKYATTVPLSDVWGSFFESAFELARCAIWAGVLDKEDVEDQDPYLFIGLSSVALQEAVLRSCGREGMTMARGIIVTDASCPEELRELYTALCGAKAAAEEASPLQPSEQEFLRQTALFAGDKTVPEPEGSSADRVAVLRRLVARVASVATCVTQLGFYRSNFSTVLERLASVSSTGPE